MVSISSGSRSRWRWTCSAGPAAGTRTAIGFRLPRADRSGREPQGLIACSGYPRPMRLTVLGGSGGFPGAGGACSGYLIEHGGVRLLVDPGYAIVPRLLEVLPAEALDAVLVSHGHPDHVADLNPLLRARALRDDPAPRLPAYAVPDALGPVLALDQIRALPGTCDLREFLPGDDL